MLTARRLRALLGAYYAGGRVWRDGWNGLYVTFPTPPAPLWFDRERLALIITDDPYTLRATDMTRLQFGAYLMETKQDTAFTQHDLEAALKAQQKIFLQILEVDGGWLINGMTDVPTGESAIYFEYRPWYITLTPATNSSMLAKATRICPTDIRRIDEPTTKEAAALRGQIAELKAQVATLQIENAVLKQAAAVSVQPRIEVKVVRDAIEANLADLRNAGWQVTHYQFVGAQLNAVLERETTAEPVQPERETVKKAAPAMIQPVPVAQGGDGAHIGQLTAPEFTRNALRTGARENLDQLKAALTAVAIEVGQTAARQAYTTAAAAIPTGKPWEKVTS